MTRPRAVIVAVALALVAGATAFAVTRDGGDRGADLAVNGAGSRLATLEAATTSTSAPPLDTTTVAPTTTTVAPTTTDAGPAASTTAAAPATTAPRSAAPPPSTAPSPTAPPATSPPSRPQPGAGPAAYQGLGTWVDAFDFHPEHSSDRTPTVVPADVDRMAAVGVETLYLQAARSEDPRAPDALMRPDLLGQFLLRAHAHGMAVVAWFLPHHVDVDDDMHHLQAMLDFEVDGHRFDSVALDIEWRNGEADHATRSARLVEVARRLRAASPDRPVGAIVMPPVATDVINPGFWPGYPWAELAPLFDVFLPMSYWTNRDAASPYRDAYTYTRDNIALLRGHVGSVPVHPIGGIGDKATHADYDGFLRAAAEAGAVGWSSYDWFTTAADDWPHLGGR